MQIDNIKVSKMAWVGNTGLMQISTLAAISQLGTHVKFYLIGYA